MKYVIWDSKQDHGRSLPVRTDWPLEAIPFLIRISILIKTIQPDQPDLKYLACTKEIGFLAKNIGKVYFIVIDRAVEF